MSGSRISTFTAEFVPGEDRGWEYGPSKVVVYFGTAEVTEFPTGNTVYMDAESLDEFVADKFGELFTLLRMSTTSDEMEV